LSAARSAFEKDGLPDELKKALAEPALNAELDHHLETGEANARANSRSLPGLPAASFSTY
jgi:putative transposase